jgi:hypothetical protein
VLRAQIAILVVKCFRRLDDGFARHRAIVYGYRDGTARGGMRVELSYISHFAGAAWRPAAVRVLMRKEFRHAK